MGRAPCCDKANVKRGPWSPEEDNTLRNYLEKHGTGGNWIALPRKAGLRRCGKSCRLRWLNYLRPDIKHGGFTQEEDNTICSLYTTLGSRWSVIAAQLPGRTDNDVKNYWNTKLKKKLLAGKIINSNNGSSMITSLNSSGEFSASTPLIKAEADQSSQGFANGNLLDASINSNNGTCSSSSSSYMSSTDMKLQQDYYEYPGEINLDQVQISIDDQFPLPGLMEVPAADKYNYYSMSMSMSMSSSSNSSSYYSSFPLENNNYTTNWSSNGAGNMLLDFDFDLLGSGSSFQGKSS